MPTEATPAVQDVVADLRKVAVCVYLAAEAGPARDIAEKCNAAASEIERLRAELEAQTAALKAADDIHASLCEEIESLMDAEPGSPREACLSLWAAHVDRYEGVRWPIPASPVPQNGESGE